MVLQTKRMAVYTNQTINQILTIIILVISAILMATLALKTITQITIHHLQHKSKNKYSHHKCRIKDYRISIIKNSRMNCIENSSNHQAEFNYVKCNNKDNLQILFKWMY